MTRSIRGWCNLSLRFRILHLNLHLGAGGAMSRNLIEVVTSMSTVLNQAPLVLTQTPQESECHSE
jgi:hypothetical protein